MQDYYKLFVQLSLQQCWKEDYDNNRKVSLHNKAMARLQQLSEELAETDCTELMTKLLIHEDDRVKINAANCCLKMNLLVEEAKATLENVMNNCEDPVWCFSAKMILSKTEYDD